MGIVVILAETIPRKIFFALNLRYFVNIPWAVPVTGLHLWVFWKHLNGSDARKRLLRANPVPIRGWLWALTAGSLGIVSLVLALNLANRFVTLPAQQLPSVDGVPQSTVLSLLLAAAPIAGLIEESAFRGYMQGANRALLRTASGHSDYRDNVRPLPPRLHANPVALLPGRRRAIWRSDQLDQFDSSGDGPAYARQHVFES